MVPARSFRGGSRTSILLLFFLFPGLCLSEEVRSPGGRIGLAFSLEEIGGYFGGRDHSTVLHADRTIRRRRRADLEFDGTIDRLTRELRAAGS